MSFAMSLEGGLLFHYALNITGNRPLTGVNWRSRAALAGRKDGKIER